MTYVLMQLHVKEVQFKKCTIKQQVAQVAVDTLKNFDHTFLNIQLFDNWTFRAPSFLVSDAEKEWSERINHEIFQLTASNRFHVDHNHFIKEFIDQGTRFKHRLYSYCVQGGVDFDMLHHLHCCKQ